MLEIHETHLTASFLVLFPTDLTTVTSGLNKETKLLHSHIVYFSKVRKERTLMLVQPTVLAFNY